MIRKFYLQNSIDEIQLSSKIKRRNWNWLILNQKSFDFYQEDNVSIFIDSFKFYYNVYCGLTSAIYQSTNAIQQFNKVVTIHFSRSSDLNDNICKFKKLQIVNKSFVNLNIIVAFRGFDKYFSATQPVGTIYKMMLIQQF